MKHPDKKQLGCQRIMEIAKREMKSGMLTYKGEEPVMVHAPRVEMMLEEGKTENEMQGKQI